MSNIINTKQLLVTIMERDVGNIYNTIRDRLLSVLDGQPAIKKIASSYISANEKKWIPMIEEKIELIAEASCIDSDTTPEEAIENANGLINDMVNDFIEKNFNISDSVSMILSLLSGS